MHIYRCAIQHTRTCSIWTYTYIHTYHRNAFFQWISVSSSLYWHVCSNVYIRIEMKWNEMNCACIDLCHFFCYIFFLKSFFQFFSVVWFTSWICQFILFMRYIHFISFWNAFVQIFSAYVAVIVAAVRYILVDSKCTNSFR